MLQHLRANLYLLILTILIGSIAYPVVLLLIGQTVFAEKANGSLIRDKSGKIIGSRLIAQPFTADEYFQPRPSSASYNGAASGATNWGGNNYLLRERVARQLGPIVKYRTGPKKGENVGPDVEKWFAQDLYHGNPGIVGQWAQMHSNVAQNWVKADKLNSEYVAEWQKSHAEDVAKWIKENPDTPEPKPEDLSTPFFVSFSAANPGKFPTIVENKLPDGKTEKRIGLAGEGSDIQGIFFDLWLQEHAIVELEDVPADMLMASGSGLDPHITVKSARYQIDRVVDKWAEKTKGDKAAIRKQVEELLKEHASAPLGGMVGVEQVNVLELNLALRDRFGAQDSTAAK